MATWKKIITSGSAAELSSLTLDTALPVAQGGIGATSLTDKAVLISQDSGTDAVGSLALTTNGSIIVGGTNGPAVEAAGDVAGTGLDASTGDGTLAINVAAAQTSITSIINSGITKIGTNASQEYITFGTTDEVNIHIDNTERLSVTATGVDVTGNLSVSATGSAGYLTAPEISGSFRGDGSNLTGVGFQIDGLSNTLTAVDQDDLLVVADNDDSNEEKKITFSNFEDQIFSNINAQSSDVSVAAGGALTLANNSVDSDEIATDAVGSDEIAAGAVGNSELKQNEDITLQALTTTNNLTVGGNLTVNGTTTTIATTNTIVEDQLMFLGTGSAGSPKDVGIIAQSGSAVDTGSAFYHDINVVAKSNPNGGRWSVGKTVASNATAITPTQFVTTVKTDTKNPSTDSGSYGAGEMHVNTSTGEIWIRFE